MFFLFFLWGGLLIFAFQNPYIPNVTPPQSPNWSFKCRLEGTWKKMGVRRRETSVLRLTPICAVLWFSSKIYGGPCALSVVVSSCCHLRSSCPTQGRPCFSRRSLRLFSWWGQNSSNTVKTREGTSRKVPPCLSLSPFSFLAFLSNVVIKPLDMFEGG